MSKEIKMPKLGLTMEEGEVVIWHKKEGDKVSVGDILVEIESDKISNEVESEIDGILAKILHEPGDVVKVGEPLGIIAESESEIEEINKGQENEKADLAEPESKESSEEKLEKEIDKSTIKRSQLAKPASPKAVRLAREKGIDIEKVDINKGVRITSEDVKIYEEKSKDIKEDKVKYTPKAEKIAEAKGLDKEKVFKESDKTRVRSEDLSEFIVDDQKSEGKVEKLSQMRKTISKRLQESWRAPHVYLRSEINIDNLIKLKEFYNEKNYNVSLTDLISIATIKALKDHPELNAHFEDDKIIKYKDVNLGMAVAVEGGLIVPVIRSADKKSLINLATNIEVMINKARSNQLDSEEYSGGTFTITNLGMFGIDEFTAVINPPQVGILAVGKKKEKLILNDDGEICKTNVINFTLGIDHRAIDGATGAEFLQTLESYINEPLLMI